MSCSNVRMIFLRHVLFWHCLVQVSTTQFCCFPAFMARVDDASDKPVPVPPLPATSLNFGFPDGSGPGQTHEHLKEIREMNAVTPRAERSQLRKPHPDHHQLGGPSHIQDHQY